MTISLDESLFGVRNFGKITLLEFAKLYNGIYNRSLFPHQIDTMLDFISRNFSRKYGIEKKREMLSKILDTNHRYGVKFEIILKYFDKYFTEYSIKIWIDGVLVNNTHQTVAITFFGCIKPYSVNYLNNAYKDYQRALCDEHYAEFKTNMARITEELISTAMHPRRLIRHLELGGEIEDW